MKKGMVETHSDMKIHTWLNEWVIFTPSFCTVYVCLCVVRVCCCGCFCISLKGLAGLKIKTYSFDIIHDSLNYTDSVHKYKSQDKYMGKARSTEHQMPTPCDDEDDWVSRLGAGPKVARKLEGQLSDTLSLDPVSIQAESIRKQVVAQEQANSAANKRPSATKPTIPEVDSPKVAPIADGKSELNKELNKELVSPKVGSSDPKEGHVKEEKAENHQTESPGKKEDVSEKNQQGTSAEAPQNASLEPEAASAGEATADPETPAEEANAAPNDSADVQQEDTLQVQVIRGLKNDSEED